MEVHFYKPSYLGELQESRNLKLAWAAQQDTASKKKSEKPFWVPSGKWFGGR
jgi:hypothetical protein